MSNTPMASYEHRKAVKVPAWDFQVYLHTSSWTPHSLATKTILLIANDPFSKFVIDNPKESKEYLASHHYSNTYDMAVQNPTTDFLLPIEIYVDKTGKKYRITSACGEPVLVLTPLLKKLVWEQQGVLCQEETRIPMQAREGKRIPKLPQVSCQGTAVCPRGDGQWQF